MLTHKKFDPNKVDKIDKKRNKKYPKAPKSTKNTKITLKNDPQTEMYKVAESCLFCDL